MEMGYNIQCKLEKRRLATWRSTQGAEEAPLLRVEAGNTGARVQISPSPPEKSTHLSTRQCVLFSTKSAFVGINPLSWMKSLRDEILLRKVKGGGFDFI